MSWHRKDYVAFALAHLQVILVAAVFVLAFFLGRCSA